MKFLRSVRLFGKHIFFPALLLWLLTLAWLVVCIFLSSQNGTETTALSQGITEVLARILHLSASAIPKLHMSLRTFAHFACFFVLCGLMSGAVAVTFPRHKYAYIWALLPCTAFALLDEIRKAAIPGRHCSIPEACLNVVGCVLGCAAFGLILWAARRRQKR